jgi:hypothetical protein
MVHGIAISDFNTATGMAELRKDIEMFNPKLRLATLPRWVIPRELHAIGTVTEPIVTILIDGIRSMQNIHSLNQRQAEEAGVMATRR